MAPSAVRRIAAPKSAMHTPSTAPTVAAITAAVGRTSSLDRRARGMAAMTAAYPQHRPFSLTVRARDLRRSFGFRGAVARRFAAPCVEFIEQPLHLAADEVAGRDLAERDT